ncbi:MAG: Calx-beta domain-containing protein [Planctomycetaceae bacterium]
MVSVDAGTVGDSSATAVQEILDADPIPDATIISTPGSTVTEGDAATFEVVLSHASHEDIVVAAAAGSGTATAGTDFDASPQNVTIPAGTLSATFTIQTTQDAVYEPDEDFSVSFSGGVTGEVNLVPGSVSGTIVS